MRNPIKKTPISLGGLDFYEVLVEDNSIEDGTCCDLCLYSDYPSFDIELNAYCAEIHGCTMNSSRYFILEPLLNK